MGVAQVFDAEKETMLQHRLYDGVFFLMGTSFRAKKYWLSVLKSFNENQNLPLSDATSIHVTFQCLREDPVRIT